MTIRFGALQWVVLVLCLGCGGLRAQSGDATIVNETTVYENQTNNNGGLDSEVCIGNVATTTTTRRGFVRYALPAIPAGATIQRVVLNFLQDRVRNMGGGPFTATLELRRVSADWVEGGGSGTGGGPCSGGSNAAGVNWATQPAVAALVSATSALPVQNLFVATMDTDIGTGNDGLISDVQAWVDNGATNFGWRLAVQQEGTANNARAMVPMALTIHWSTAPAELIFENGFEPPP